MTTMAPLPRFLSSTLRPAQSTRITRFLGVARFQDRAVVASHAYNTVIDLNGVKEVLKSDQLSVRPGVHFSFASGGSAWHLMSGACVTPVGC